MKHFMNDDFLLHDESSQRLYHDYSAPMPIIDYHCHLPPADIANDARFANLAHAWLGGDHYKWRVMLSNGVESKIGTLGSKYEYFSEWKRLNEGEQGVVSLETMLRGICKKETFLDLLENFIIYDHSDNHTAKILARNHQYLGVNEAIEAYRDRKLRDGK